MKTVKDEDEGFLLLEQALHEHDMQFLISNLS